MVYKKLDCNDCVKPINVRCLGGHETSDLPCHAAQMYNCKRKCGQILPCTHHACEFECHDVKKSFIWIKVSVKINNFYLKITSRKCEECEKACEQPRPAGCMHECSIGNCHIGHCKDCKQLIKMKCHCKMNFVYVECE